MKILLIDDEEAILDVFKQALEQSQHEVVTAITGNDGMQKAKTEHPDVIFLDQVLPDMNGNQVLQFLKADPETKQIPVAILSNFNQDTLVQNAIKMGASDYILKYQIAPHDLTPKAEALLKEATTPSQFSQPEEAFAPAPSAEQNPNATGESVNPSEPNSTTAPSSPTPPPVPAAPVEEEKIVN